MLWVAADLGIQPVEGPTPAQQTTGTGGNCYCAEWSQGYYSEPCLYYCAGSCGLLLANARVLALACMAACRPACYVSPQCVRVVCVNYGDPCRTP